MTLQEVIDLAEDVERGMNAQINLLSLCNSEIPADDIATLLTLHLEKIQILKKELSLLSS